MEKIIIIFITVILLFSANHVLAAQLYFSPVEGNFSQDQTLVVELKINTENVPVNTIEGYLRFSQDIFSLEGLSDGNSIINFWVKKPISKNGLISFIGIIPGGYNGKDGTLIKILLKPVKVGLGEIKIEQNSQVLLNDGQGTKAKINYGIAFLNIIKNGIYLEVNKDVELPESFSPQIARDPDIFGGQWFLTFSTQDKNSGIDHYEVQETRDKEQRTNRWIVAESPYVLEDQKLHSYIYVRVVDKAGNKKIASLSPTFVPWYKKPIVRTYVVLAIVIVLLLLERLWKKLKRK
ncbi:MAG: hypothetical protein HYT39_00710 [Candidatus Sungbacteria bacterium]|nr:hypothetical protein [Candidatus Sungbacteria bacterium]